MSMEIGQFLVADPYPRLIEDLKHLIEKLIINNIGNINPLFNNGIDNINMILNTLFSSTDDNKTIFIYCVFIFLMFYTEFINKSLGEETHKIYTYLKDPTNKKYKINYSIIDSVYVIIASLIETNIKTKNDNFLKTFDIILTKNIDIIQENKDIDYDPLKTPVIKELLQILSPAFDTINVYNLVVPK